MMSPRAGRLSRIWPMACSTGPILAWYLGAPAWAPDASRDWPLVVAAFFHSVRVTLATLAANLSTLALTPCRYLSRAAAASMPGARSTALIPAVHLGPALANPCCHRLATSAAEGMALAIGTPSVGGY